MIETAVGKVNEESDTDAKEIALPKLTSPLDQIHSPDQRRD